jgi:adenylyltransferase/sulfurtransferase
MNEWEITPVELKQRMDKGDKVFVLDVREPNEFQICRIPGSVLIPLAQLPNRLAELPGPGDGRELIVHCKMGGRSAKAVKLLQEHGFTHAHNLTGGILAWIDRIDPSQPKY